MIWLGISAAVSSIFAQVSSEPKLSLDDALNIAMKNAFSVRLAQSRLEKATQQKNQARGLLGPSLTLGGTYTRFDDASALSGGGQFPGGFSTKESKQARLSLNYNIDITGATRKTVRAAEFGEYASREILGAETVSLKARVRSAYYEVLKARALVKVQEDALANARERLDKAQKRFEAGAIARFDVLRFDTDVARSESGLIAARGGLQLAKNALNSVLGRPIETPFEPVVEDGLPVNKLSAEELARWAWAHRPEVKASQYSIDALANTRAAQEQGTLPSLQLSATHQRNINAGPFIRESNNFASLALVFPLFDSGITRARVKAARQDEMQAKIRHEELKLAIALEVRQALVRLDNARQSLEVAQRAVAQDREALRIAQLLFDTGKGIFLDVIDAQTQLTRSETALVNARYEYLSAYAELQRAVGLDNFEPQSANIKEEKRS